jgi:hypothetical protein
MSYSFTDAPCDIDDEFDGWDDDMRAPALTLSAEQQVALASAVGRGLDERGCDNTLRAAQRWAAGAGVDWPTLQSRLEGNGGYCDCELLFNVIVLAEDEPDPD